ncbi:hypothetical protein HYH03_017404 [Edaphochlamys debaryana]|uniref:Endonuclease/exonuclease/phosphatase domain-containing protein n=1 Tax=Edaphochlamys debaryana TaxID=47281 RepID=A0A835XHZ5_9CHLO|nr:hypothetical protein HYH03_017404 [Edaphochlamys debaryana]|eukprot:KAG2483749.1 hypothetical protein HYH03_017404 [Edaphochlamys debaryana]
MPWVPRPQWLARPPQATLLLGSWNLQHFTLNAALPRAAAQKVAHVAATLRDWAAAEGAGGSVVVALQEVMTPEAVPFLAAYLTERAAEPGGGGRVWHCATSGPVGSNAERSAFLWSGPPPPQAPSRRSGGGWRSWFGAGAGGSAGAGAGAGPGPGGGARRGPQAPLHADPGSCFSLLGEEDLAEVLRNRGQEVAGGRFLRSPYYGLFRLGHANLLLANVHLAADLGDAREELAALHRLAAAAQRPNARLFRRHSLGGRLVSRRQRGLMAVLGDFNCPAPAASSTPARPSAAGPAKAQKAKAGGGTAAGATPAEPYAVVRLAGGDGGSGPAEAKGKAAAAPAAAGPAGAAGPSVAPPAADGWGAFLSHGWVNALALNPGQPGSSAAAAAAAPPHTTWRCQKPRSIDAICLPCSAVPLVTGRGVVPPPPHVLAAVGAAAAAGAGPGQGGGGAGASGGAGGRGGGRGPGEAGAGVSPTSYPDHLLAWTRLDLGPLQRAPGKLRSLQTPEVAAAGEGS